MPCVLRYWDPAQKCYISYKDFHLSENNSSSIPFPDPSTADPSEVIVAAEWQMVVDVTVDIEYPDDGRLVFFFFVGDDQRTFFISFRRGDRKHHSFT